MTPKVKCSATQLKECLIQLLKKYGIENCPEDIPKKWQKHGDLILLPSSSLQTDVWVKLGNEVWEVVAEALKCKRIARKHKIQNDDFRSPTTELLKGNDSWVTHSENHIKLTFDVTKCMFSSGNISEKLRIARFDCTGETVVDLYAGIGYFTLPFLVHSKATLVHACEWNFHAVEALKKNLKLNKVEDKCVVHFGDNRLMCPKGIADRVNLGLIPTSKASWKISCEALKPTSGGILHVHEIVTSGMNKDIESDKREVQCTFSCNKHIKTEWIIWVQEISTSFHSIFKDSFQNEWTVNVFHVEHVKSYAPHVDHMVADVECKPVY